MASFKDQVMAVYTHAKELQAQRAEEFRKKRLAEAQALEEQKLIVLNREIDRIKEELMEAAKKGSTHYRKEMDKSIIDSVVYHFKSLGFDAKRNEYETARDSWGDCRTIIEIVIVLENTV